MFKPLATFGILFFIILNATAQFKSVEVTVKQSKTNGIYTAKDSKVGLYIKIKNNQNDNVKGTCVVVAFNQFNQSIHQEEMSVFINPKGNFYKLLQINASKFTAGFYTIQLTTTTNYGVEALKEVVAVDPDRMKPVANQPTDFIAFWNEAKTELAQVNPQYKITRRGDVSTVNNDVFLVEFKSINNTIIRGWLSVPKTGKKVGVLYKFAQYAQPASIDNRNNVATFCIDARGIGLSADNLQLNANDYLTTGITNKYTSVYRSLYMDALRGVDFLWQNGQQFKLDTSKIVTYGEGQGASVACITAALDKRVKGVIANRIQLADTRTAVALGEQQNNAFPVANIKQFTKSSGVSLDNFFKTWDYFDAQSFAPLIQCSIVVATNIKDASNYAQAAYNFYNQLLTTKREFYSVADVDNGMNNRYYIFENNWIKETMRLPN